MYLVLDVLLYFMKSLNLNAAQNIYLCEQKCIPNAMNNDKF